MWTEAEAGQLAQDTITDRIVTIFRRWAPTISGWSASPILLEGTPFQQVTDRARYAVIQARTLLARTSQSGFPES